MQVTSDGELTNIGEAHSARSRVTPDKVLNHEMPYALIMYAVRVIFVEDAHASFMHMPCL